MINVYINIALQTMFAKENISYLTDNERNTSL